MQSEKGNISIHSDNIMPIIKKWLYSDRDIFIREMISNACDAINKYNRLVSLGEVKGDKEEKYCVKVLINSDDKTISFVDNGIGMTGEEVKKYINQIAFSGAMDFIEKYKDKTDAKNDIIGHFGLGFYSAFMVSDKVQIDTLSYQEGAEAVKWTSEGGVEYRMEKSDRKERGTTVTLSINKDNEDFLEEFKTRQVLMKYCYFMPFEIYLEDKSSKKESEKKEDKEDKEKKKDEKPKPLNDSSPLWLKKPADCKDEEYKEFYHKVFTDFNEPLFWIHLNMDYPFRLKGILYFPKLKHEFEPNEGQIKLYNNQVFVADNIKEVIPEFLLMLKGTLDCPDLPLNVSRSFLQNDGYVNKISNHITKKVADKLTSLFKKSREDYDRYWDDIHPFVKYGCMREDKFYDRVSDIIVYKTTKGDHVTLQGYLERNSDKHENKVFYVTDEKQQSQYIRLFREHDMEAVILDSLIDTHFVQFMETKNTEVKFNRIDSDLSDSLKGGDEGKEGIDENSRKELENIFKKALENDKLNLRVESLKSDDVPSVMLLSEQSRRMQDMSRMFGGMNANPDMFPGEETLVLNSRNSLIKTLLSLSSDKGRKEDVKMISQHIYDLAVMAHKQLEPEAMTKFIERSNRLLTRLAISR